LKAPHFFPNSFKPGLTLIKANKKSIILNKANVFQAVILKLNKMQDIDYLNPLNFVINYF